MAINKRECGCRDLLLHAEIHFFSWISLSHREGLQSCEGRPLAVLERRVVAVQIVNHQQGLVATLHTSLATFQL